MSGFRKAHRRAFTLIELIITIGVLGIIVLAVLPSFTSDEPIRLIAASNIVTSDIEFAQAESLNSPANPVIVRIDVEAQQYWLALLSDPEAPILRPGTEDPYVITFGDGGDEVLAGITITPLSFEEEGIISFDSFGRLVQFDNLTVQLTNGAGDIYVIVTATTGSVAISGEAPE